MNDIQLIRRLKDVDDELDYLQETAWLDTPEENSILKCRVKVQETLYDLTNNSWKEDFEGLQEEYTELALDLGDAHTEIKKLQTKLGEFEAKTQESGKITDNGWPVSDDFSGYLFNRGDEVQDNLTKAVGVITGLVEEPGAVCPRYEVTVVSDIYGEFPIYVREGDLTCTHKQEIVDDLAGPMFD
jgi:chromosome segregation ATPase